LTTAIEGAAPRQETILRAILARMQTRRLEALRIRPHAGQADAVEVELLRPGEADLRTDWEFRLLVNAFSDRSEEEGLPRVARAKSSQGGMPPSPGERNRVERAELEERILIAAARTRAVLERLEILEPARLAPTVTLAVPEPHAFLRHGLDAYEELAGHSADDLDGSYLELTDGEADPVLATGYARYWGGGGLRGDVRCCYRLGWGSLCAPDPPPCPMLARTRTWDDMWAAFRRNLCVKTGRSIEQWAELVEAQPVASADGRYAWLRQEHGLGEATAGAILDRVERGRR